MQLWALGRAAFEKEFLDPSFAYISASDIHLEGRPNPPRPLTEEEVKEYIELYTIAAKNAVEKAGFDGVEVHGANGYLVDQFTQDVTNKRTDEYGGSIEKRSRFALQVIDSIALAIGPEKTAIRLSPWSIFQGEDTRHLCNRITESFSN
jgi:NADPH2 dehydrogenase